MVKMIVKAAIFLVVFFAVSVFLLRGNPTSEPTTFANHAMTIPYRIVIGKQLDQQEKENIQQLIASTFDEINKTYNRWNPLSELSKLNNLKAGEKKELSPQLEKFLLRAKEMTLLTGGRFDPTIEPLQNLWKECLEQGIIPAEQVIQERAKAVGWKNIHIENGTVVKEHDLASIDLGGIAKGYLLDLLVEKLNKTGYKDVLVEWGGELKASGKHPSGRSWNIYITHLEDADPSNALDQVSLDNKAIATSGDYQQFWKAKGPDGEELHYFHIINPFTLRPMISKSGSIASVSVTADDCAFADGLATAGMVFDNLEAAQQWATAIQQQYPDVTFWFIVR